MAQDKTQLFERRRKVMELKLAGWTYARIGPQLGISPQLAHNDVEVMMRDYAREPATEVRDQEVARLDRALSSIWNKVLAGEYEAIDRMLKIMDRRAKLLGLDAPQKINVVDYIRGRAIENGMDPDAAVEEARAIIESANF